MRPPITEVWMVVRYRSSRGWLLPALPAQGKAETLGASPLQALAARQHPPGQPHSLRVQMGIDPGLVPTLTCGAADSTTSHEVALQASPVRVLMNQAEADAQALESLCGSMSADGSPTH